MEGRKIYIKRPVLLLVLVLAFFACLCLRARGDIGMSERAMCRDNADYMDDGDTVKSQIGESMAAFLQYNIEADDYDLDIYVKRRNRIGWFFRFGGSSGAQDYLVQFNCEGNDEYVLTYLSAASQGNTPAVRNIEVQKENGETMSITPEAGAPFAYVMDHSWNVIVYGSDGSIICPIERSL